MSLRLKAHLSKCHKHAMLIYKKLLFSVWLLNMYDVMSNTSRQFIRHPSDIPIEYRVLDIPPQYSSNAVKNVSVGGLSFYSKYYIKPEQWLHLYIPVSEEYFEANAQVRWCNPSKNGQCYNIGVSFTTDNEAYSARMVEQVCHIEHYRKKVLKEEGRALSSDQAAAEWIEKFAPDFPPADELHYDG